MEKDLGDQNKKDYQKMMEIISIKLRSSLMDPHTLNRLQALKAIDPKLNIADLKEPDTKENLLIAHALQKLSIPDEKQMLKIFKYVFEDKKCDPNHLIKLGDGIDKVAKAYFNERRNVYINTFLHTLIVNEHHSASGNSLVENVLNLPPIIEKFNFNKKDVIIEGLEKEIAGDGNATYILGPNYNEKEGKTILVLAAKMRKASIVEQLCKLKKNYKGINIDLDATDENGHTALFYSCALGDLESTKALLDAGAKSDGIKEKLIEFYRDNESGVSKILKSVAIDPDRDEKALSNYFVHPNNHQPKLSDDHKINKGNEEIIISTINRIEKKPTEFEKMLQEARDEFLQFARTQILDPKGKTFLTGKSLLKSCLEGQVECLELLSRKLGFKSAESPPGSVFSPEGRTLAPSKPSRVP
jgi:ankyrin repeat protein